MSGESGQILTGKDDESRQGQRAKAQHRKLPYAAAYASHPR